MLLSRSRALSLLISKNQGARLIGETTWCLDFCGGSGGFEEGTPLGKVKNWVAGPGSSGRGR